VHPSNLSKFLGKHYFFRPDTKITAWTLDPRVLRPETPPPTSEEPKSVLPDIGLKVPSANEKTSLFRAFRTSSLSQSTASSGDHEKLQLQAKNSSRAASAPELSPIAVGAKRVLADVKKIDSVSLVVVGGLGQGGYSDVVRVKQTGTGKEYSMKVVAKKRVGNTKQSRDRLLLEHRLMTEMAPSPFVQRCHASFESPTNIFFVVDLILGGDLYTKMVSRFTEENGWIIPENECRVVLAELVLAIKHVHKHGYLHKDIKVENVMLDHNGHVKLVDFGLAEAIKAEVGPVEVAGSIAYFAPELLQHQTGGRHTDWWAFGVLSYELLTGCTPWSSLNDGRTLKRDILRLPIDFSYDLTEPAIEFLKNLLQRDFRDRLGTRSDRQVQRASFFEEVDWAATARLECAPAFPPGENFINETVKQKALSSYMSRPELPEDEMDTWFIGFEKVAEHPWFSET